VAGKLKRYPVVRDHTTPQKLELYTDSVFRYEPFGIFSVFSYRIPKGNSVGKFGILNLAGAPFSQRKGGFGPLKKGVPAKFSKKEFPPNLQKVFPPNCTVKKYPQ
jgi:hypothetical protein